MAECRICTSETDILTAQDEEEYDILKEHVMLNDVLQAKYPFKKNSGVLIDNGKDAKACQISQERRQVHSRTHDQ